LQEGAAADAVAAWTARLVCASTAEVAPVAAEGDEAAVAELAAEEGVDGDETAAAHEERR